MYTHTRDTLKVIRPLNTDAIRLSPKNPVGSLNCPNNNVFSSSLVYKIHRAHQTMSISRNYYKLSCSYYFGTKLEIDHLFVA